MKCAYDHDLNTSCSMQSLGQKSVHLSEPVPEVVHVLLDVVHEEPVAVVTFRKDLLKEELSVGLPHLADQ